MPAKGWWHYCCETSNERAPAKAAMPVCKMPRGSCSTGAVCSEVAEPAWQEKAALSMAALTEPRPPTAGHALPALADTYSCSLRREACLPQVVWLVEAKQVLRVRSQLAWLQLLDAPLTPLHTQAPGLLGSRSPVVVKCRPSSTYCC